MLLQGKKGVVFGVANKNSLAWHIASVLHQEGAELVLGVASERFQKKVRPLAKSLGLPEPVICDVNSDASIAVAMQQVGRRLKGLDFLVHSIAFARREDLEGRFVEVDRDGWRLAQEISAYSFVALARAAEPFLNPGASLLTLTYLGSNRAMASYNVMGPAKAALESAVRYLALDMGQKDGARVNAISAGPVRTLSSAAIPGLKDKMAQERRINPLRRTLHGEEVGKAAAFLVSDLASAITGEILHVDCGYHVLGAYST